MAEKYKEVISSITKKWVATWNEYIWPVASSALFCRPLHFAATRFIADIHRGDRVLELGSGYPWYEMYSGKTGPEGIFVALDINPRIQRNARSISGFVDRYLRRKTKPTVNHIVAGVTELPFADNSFDHVLVNNGPHWSQEIHRVLKPGGQVLIAMTDPALLPIQTGMNFATYRESFKNVKMFPGVPAFFIPDKPLISIWNWYVSAEKPNSNT